MGKLELKRCVLRLLLNDIDEVLVNYKMNRLPGSSCIIKEQSFTEVLNFMIERGDLND